MSKSKCPEFVVTLRALPTDDDSDLWRRLRAFLKNAVRCWRLQCVKIVPADPEDKSTEATK